MRYYIADLHFFHTAMIHSMDCRNFKTMEEMNEYMIAKWNQKVRHNDEVVILGDFSWGNAQETNSLLERLKGRLYLIQGNHDTFLKKKHVNLNRFPWVKPYDELSDQKRKIIVCHYPIMCYNGQYRLDEAGNPKTYMLYGHVHNSRDEELIRKFQEITRQTPTVDVQGNARNIPCQMINCFCMYSDYEPLTLDEWIVCDRERQKSCQAGK